MVGVEAQNEQYKCTQDAECQNKFDANHCKARCLKLPSICINGLCACPFGPEHSAVIVIKTSTCSGDSDCIKFCPIECSIKSCKGGSVHVAVMAEIHVFLAI